MDLKEEQSRRLPDHGQNENLSNLRPTSIATGLPWHVATGRLDKQLLTAAKKDNLKNHNTVGSPTKPPDLATPPKPHTPSPKP